MSVMQFVLVGFVVLVLYVFNVLVLKPRSLRAKLQRQGINGPTPHFFFGNIPEMKSTLLQVQSTKQDKEGDENDHDLSLSHTWPSTMFPHVQKWRNRYGSMFLFSKGNIQCLMVMDIEMVKQIILYTSLNLGKPTYVSKSLKPFLGQGIISSNGPLWAHQRKIIAPQLYLDKVKAMVNLVVDSTNIMLRSWETRLEREGGVSEIKVDEDLKNLSADVIAKACFGSNYIEAKEIFTKLRDLQRVISMSYAYAGIPGFLYLPIRTNRKIWRLEKDINSMIMKLIKQRMNQAQEQDLLQMILEGAKNCEDSDGILSNSASRDRFMIDNCKNIFSSGHESTAITATWCLMLLAAHHDCQDRVRAEVLEVCGSDPPNASMLRNLEKLNNVIQETLRLYPPSPFINRAALQDIDIKGILIPKGMSIQIPMAMLQQDPELWGPDAHEFNPERFSNGVIGATKFPQAYTPFGIGTRVCVGQHLAMAELKDSIAIVHGKIIDIVDGSKWWYPTCKCLKFGVAENGTYHCPNCARHVFNVSPSYKIVIEDRFCELVSAYTI
ncbi:hypothetical protein RIF29_18353 [Crotalaria pallida]|uniref:Cytochrome P450 n=1 Tax=Crotalaria pallida TaxID=3830 RepID=A0AAN9FIR9_CROPI